MSTSPKIEPHDALKLLAGDHAALLAMFRDYERHGAKATAVDKGKAALRLCHRMSIHCTIKEEIFYPAATAVLGAKADDVLTAVEGQLGKLRGDIVIIEHKFADDADFDAAVKTLAGDARRHFDDEENKLFSKLRHAGFDLAGTGERLATRQLQLATEPAGAATIREARRVLGG